MSGDLNNIVQGPSGTINVESIDFDGQNVTIDAGGSISIDGTADSNLTVTGSNKDLDIAVAGGSTQELRIASAGTATTAITITSSAGGITFNCAEGKLILTLGAIPHKEDGIQGDLSAGTLYRDGTHLLIGE